MEITDGQYGTMERSRIESEAKRRYGESDSYQAVLASEYRRFHHYAFPPPTAMSAGDQWAAHAAENIGKIHVTANVAGPFARVDARLQAIEPRITIPTANLNDADRRRAEATEQVALTWLELSGWDVWRETLCLTRSIYGKGVLKPFWNDRDNRGDVYVIENVHDLRIGWGRSDFSVIDWALYESRMSVAEVRRTFRDVDIEVVKRGDGYSFNVRYPGTPTDPLGQSPSAVTPYRQPSQYEDAMVNVWDYWWIDDDRKVMNVTLIAGCCVEEPKAHPEMPTIPYIVVENDHEPGNPDGVSTLKDLIDLQDELNRLLTHAYQHVQDNVDPAFYAYGEDGMNIEAGTVPKPGEILPVGDARIEPITTTTNTMPFADLIGQTFNLLHRMSGLPEILFGDAPSDISGRATAIQIQSAINRIDPRRKHLFRAYSDLLRFWMFMGERKNPRMPMGVDEETGEERFGRLADMIRGFNRWRIVAPEITPRDAAELATNEINKVSAGLSSRRTSMDAIGIESPEAELEMIGQERSDLDIMPDAVSQKVSAYLMMLQFNQMLQQMQMQQEQLDAQAGQIGGTGMSPTAQAQRATNQAQMNAFGAQPTAVGEDQNQPMTTEGSPPPAGGSAPEVQTLVRPGNVLTQTAYNTQLGG